MLESENLRANGKTYPVSLTGCKTKRIRYRTIDAPEMDDLKGSFFLTTGTQKLIVEPKQWMRFFERSSHLSKLSLDWNGNREFLFLYTYEASNWDLARVFTVAPDGRLVEIPVENRRYSADGAEVSKGAEPIRTSHSSFSTVIYNQGEDGFKFPFTGQTFAFDPAGPKFVESSCGQFEDYESGAKALRADASVHGSLPCPN